MTPSEKAELRLLIREEVSNAIAQLNPPRYASSRKAAMLLGYSYRQLIRAVEEGVLRVGKEVQDRRASDSSKASYYFDIPACEKRLKCPPEKRK